jgi:hypothetical protein
MLGMKSGAISDQVALSNYFVSSLTSKARREADTLRRQLKGSDVDHVAIPWLTGLRIRDVDINATLYVPYRNGKYFCPLCAMRSGKQQAMTAADHVTTESKSAKTGGLSIVYQCPGCDNWFD